MISKDQYDSALRDPALQSSGSITRKQAVQQFTQILQQNAREQDKEMFQRIAQDFVVQQNKAMFTKKDIEQIRDLNQLQSFAQNWLKHMYDLLIDFYDIQADNEFKNEMLNDPDFYGLTYDAYKIMTFKLDDTAVKEEL
eukprot:TRINITY_DN10802_c0_g1_i2.p2 TRINITY_DN10802_c0_g1~~TRINITY_DN10802_c0_g1_i2.p2  ORF type:complete len:139 (-),score=13.56 TRINITY_DN10802_c0_g1_i2:156-572(-)